jgi:hypothetical protein
LERALALPLRYAAEMTRPVTLALFLAMVSACDKKDDAKAAPAPAPAAGEKPAAAAGPKGTGLEDPANDPKVVGLAKKALACKYGSSFDDGCADYKAWQDERDAFKDGKADGTLVALIEDSDVKVRDLGLRKFSVNGSPALKDKALSERLVTVAEKAKGWTEMHTYLLGNIVGHIKIGDSGLFPRLKALVSSADVDSSLRRAIVDGLLYSNDTSDDVWALTRDTLKDADKQVARNALRAFWTGASDKTLQARCDIYKELVEGPDEDFAASAGEYLTRPQAGCKTHFDAVLTSLEARVKAKKMTVAPFVETLANVCEPNLATPAQVKKANALAHQLADDKKGQGWARSAALEAAAKCDPKSAKAYLGKFKQDADKEVKAKATELLAKK